MELINKIIIIVASLLKALKNKFLNLDQDNYEKKVLILFSGIIGDAVCFLDSKDEYKKIFSDYCVVYAFKSEVHKFYKACGIENDNEIFELDFNRYCRDFKYYRFVNKEFSRIKFSHIIAPQKSISAAIVSLNLYANEKITLDHSLKIKNKFIGLIYGLAFNKFITVDKNCTHIKAMNLIINYYSNNFIPACMPQIPNNQVKLDTYYSQEKYCVIAPISSRYEKEWDLFNYVEIVNNIVERGYKVYICGMKIEEKKISEFYKKIRNSSYVINKLGKTDFKEWISMIRNAKLVIGCDSASIHIAAATNTPSVCINSGMDYNLMYPYQLDKIIPGQFLPQTVSCNVLKCFGCRRIGGKYGYGNKKCANLIKKGEPMLCIQNITVEDVWSKIEKIKMKEDLIWN